MEQLLKTRDSHDPSRGTPAAWVNMLIKQEVRQYYKARVACKPAPYSGPERRHPDRDRRKASPTIATTERRLRYTDRRHPPRYYLVPLEKEVDEIADTRHDTPGERVDLERFAADLLPLDQRLLKDVLLNGMSFKDFAQAQHISRKTVQRHIKCLRAKLRSHLQ